jgi:hypothetical protein
VIRQLRPPERIYCILFLAVIVQTTEVRSQDSAKADSFRIGLLLGAGMVIQSDPSPAPSFTLGAYGGYMDAIFLEFEFGIHETQRAFPRRAEDTDYEEVQTGVIRKYGMNFRVPTSKNQLSWSFLLGVGLEAGQFGVSKWSDGEPASNAVFSTGLSFDSRVVGARATARMHFDKTRTTSSAHLQALISADIFNFGGDPPK